MGYGWDGGEVVGGVRWEGDKVGVRGIGWGW